MTADCSYLLSVYFLSQGQMRDNSKRQNEVFDIKWEEKCTDSVDIFMMFGPKIWTPDFGWTVG